MGLNLVLYLALTYISTSLAVECPDGLIQSASCESSEDCSLCVGRLSLLVGGRNLMHWRRDAEIWDEEGKLDISIADFPFKLDTPYIWWSTEAQSVVVCGGMNWDTDQSDDRCWTYDTCGDTWRHVTTLPWPVYGGVSARAEGGAGEELWVVGGGNGTASNKNLILKYAGGDWTIEETAPLHEARFGSCGAVVGDKIYVIGGRSDEVLDTVEVVDLVTREVTTSDAWVTPHPRWGAACLPHRSGVMMVGGMDAMFLPHASVDILDPVTMTWTPGPPLPWAQSGGGEAVTSLGPTIYSGFGFSSGYTTSVVSMDEAGDWVTWAASMDTARVSGASVSVPVDMFESCNLQ